MTTSSLHVARDAGPDAVVGADLTQLFAALQELPMPLAILDESGRPIMANEALSKRYGRSVLKVTGFDKLQRHVDECRVGSVSSDDGTVLDEYALVMNLHDQCIVMPGFRVASSVDEEIGKMRCVVDVLQKAAATDHLTGAWNRSQFDRVIESEMARCEGAGAPLSLVLFDIDHFKRVNDTFGHDAGDRVLQAVVDIVARLVGTGGDLFRWGGEEFAVLIRDGGHRSAARMAERIRLGVANHGFDEIGTLTISAGVAERLSAEGPVTWFKRLDQALYQAKHGGRNCIVVDRQGISDSLDFGSTPLLEMRWHEAYEVGHSIIDAQHRELFARANTLIQATLQGQDHIQAPLDELLSHVVRHFADEEDILRAHGYPQLASHECIHEALLERAFDLQRKVYRGDATVGSVVDFVTQEVVVRHILVADRSFSTILARSAITGCITDAG